jgi:hypothetical protein
VKDQFNGNTEKMRHPPHLTGHKVYEIVKDVHVVLGKRKKDYQENWRRWHVEEAIDVLGAIVLERLRRPSFDWCDARREEYVWEPTQDIA